MTYGGARGLGVVRRRPATVAAEPEETPTDDRHAAGGGLDDGRDDQRALLGESG